MTDKQKKALYKEAHDILNKMNVILDKVIVRCEAMYNVPIR